jgi:hypothetical protein
VLGTVSNVLPLSYAIDAMNLVTVRTLSRPAHAPRSTSAAMMLECRHVCCYHDPQRA